MIALVFVIRVVAKEFMPWPRIRVTLRTLQTFSRKRPTKGFLRLVVGGPFVMWVVVDELTHGFAENYSDFICLKLKSNDSIQNVKDCINSKFEILLSLNKKKTLEVMVKMKMLS